MNELTPRTFKALVYAASLLIVFAGGLKLVDRFVLEKGELVTRHPAGDPDTLAVFQKDIYPHTGGHTQANFVVSLPCAPEIMGSSWTLTSMPRPQSSPANSGSFSSAAPRPPAGAPAEITR